MLLLVCGSRSFGHVPQEDDDEFVIERYEDHKARMTQRLAAILADDITILHGKARGADMLADVVADELGYDKLREPPDYDRYGKSAPIVRNKKMLDMKPDLVIAFWDGVSHGTKFMINESAKRGIPLQVVLF